VPSRKMMAASPAQCAWHIGCAMAPPRLWTPSPGTQAVVSGPNGKKVYIATSENGFDAIDT